MTAYVINEKLGRDGRGLGHPNIKFHITRDWDGDITSNSQWKREETCHQQDPGDYMYNLAPFITSGHALVYLVLGGVTR